MNANFVMTFKNQMPKIKLLPLLMGAVCLTVSAATIPAVFAQSTPPSTPPASEGQHPHRHENWLNLTSEQQEQVQRIREAQRQQMDSILTAEQRAQLETARANGEHPRQVFESLNLTEEQRSQMREVHEAFREQMDAILTPEQREQLQQRRPHYQGGGQPAQ